MAISFEQVLVFHKIIQTGSFKAAAAELHKTQPAISLSIKKLEEELEVDLFDRSGYRPELTDYGKSFFERSFKVLQGMDELEGMTQSFRKKEETEISVAIDGISPLPNLLHLFKNFGERFPFTKLNLTYETLSETESRVLNHEAQIGITHFITEHQSLEVLSFSSVDMIPVMSKELFNEKKIKTQDELKDILQIVVGDQQGVKGQSFGLLDDGRKWRIKDNNFKREIIFAGLGWGHLPLHSIKREIDEGKLVVIEFENIHPRELIIYIVRHKKLTLGPVAKALWGELSDSKNRLR